MIRRKKSAWKCERKTELPLNIKRRKARHVRRKVAADEEVKIGKGKVL